MNILSWKSLFVLYVFVKRMSSACKLEINYLTCLNLFFCLILCLFTFSHISLHFFVFYIYFYSFNNLSTCLLISVSLTFWYLRLFLCAACVYFRKMSSFHLLLRCVYFCINFIKKDPKNTHKVHRIHAKVSEVKLERCYCAAVFITV